MLVFHNHVLTNTTPSPNTVAEGCSAFTEDMCTGDLSPADGLFRDKSLYEGQHQGTFHNHVLTNDTPTPNTVAEGCNSSIDDGAANIGVVKADIFGNQISNQKRTGGWS
jgi:hypothetical protein